MPAKIKECFKCHETREARDLVMKNNNLICKSCKKEGMWEELAA
jgi:formylmethanofuran dehydrogenase subunit E